MKKILFSRRTLSWLLTTALLLSTVAFTVSAEDEPASPAAPSFESALAWKPTDGAAIVLLNNAVPSRIFSFTVATAGNYHLASDTAGTAMDPAVELWCDGAKIAENDNFAGSNFGLNAPLEAEKTYYAVVTAQPTALYQPFEISLTEGEKAAPEAPSKATGVEFVEERGDIALGFMGWPEYAFLPEGSAEIFVGLKSKNELCYTNDGFAAALGNGSMYIYTGSDLEDFAADYFNFRIVEPPALELNKPVDVKLSRLGKAQGFSFTAPAAGDYTFAALPNAYDTFLYVYTRDPANRRAMLEQIDSGDDENGRSFIYTATMEEGETLFFSAGRYGNEPAEYQMVVTTAPAAATDITVTAVGDTIIGEDSSAIYATFGEDSRTQIDLFTTFVGEGAVKAEELSYTLSDPSLATINADGVLSLYRPGKLTVTITAESGLTTEITFVLIDFNTGVALGDVNADNKIDSTDARLVLQYFVGSVKADELFLCAADVDGNNVVDSTDARLILQYFVGTIKEFPAA